MKNQSYILLTFGAAFELSLGTPAFNHKLKRFCTFRGFLKPHKWTEELRIGQCNGYYMEHCGSGTPKPANKSKMENRLTHLPLSVARHCSVLVLPFNFVFLFYKIKLFFTFLYVYHKRTFRKKSFPLSGI